MSALVTAGILLLASTGAWTIVLAGAGGRSGVAVVLMSISLWVATVAAIAGMLLSRSHWARRLGLAATGGQAGLAVISPVDTWWWVAAMASVLAAVSVAGPWLNGIVRSLPAANGPPPRAVLVPLLLVAAPFLIGLTGGAGALTAVVGGSALVAAFWFIRTLPMALTVVRLVWPAFAFGSAWFMGWPAGAVAVAMGIVVSVVAWDSSVTRAVIPVVKRGSVIPIPPELTPRDVLDAAQLDERGRRR